MRKFVPATTREPEPIMLPAEQPPGLQSSKRLKQTIAGTPSERSPIRIPLNQRQQPDLRHASG